MKSLKFFHKFLILSCAIIALTTAPRPESVKWAPIVDAIDPTYRFQQLLIFPSLRDYDN